MSSTTMAAQNGDRLRAREALAASVRGGFEKAGYAPVSAPALQPADIFLDMSGEDIRRRMYVFTDPAGDELCLRPELTIPVCRLYLEEGGGTKKLCSVGPVYRYQQRGSAKLREFTQAGVEWLDAADAEVADAEVMVLGARALAEAGLKEYDVAMGDLALFDALIDALDLPPGWRSRLKRHFWRPDYFRELLDRLAKGDAGEEAGDRQALISAIAGLDDAQAKDVIEDVLKLAGIAPVGGRTVEEVAERLIEQAELASSSVPKAAAELISEFLAVSGRPQEGIACVRKLAEGAGVSIEPAIARFERRLDLSAKAGFDLSRAHFATGFGRNMAYYTGFVFEFRVPALEQDSMICGGGRYDGLLSALGSEKPVPAVGCAVGIERLLAAIAKEQGR
ncbi:ATP phosphoribosyltransferase regulatory subunit [Parvibaculum sp.]|uniref:ATP phosphoribosyltransferase regulatory subunit n=1 Tax=Parvibaculum sp. TaxID=2024848 RepID=UPI001B1D55F6|nr:ATP phosphoribosyltransferase regulatory subunit [Parvibaculum sp.]MBO6633284.1 ATP phosphoribosyltransferase regulatory subunit [Parvibaculum sp.]MBO6678321.1 ATP phosphoribosyltransferase regulatory subunit [Parvibaculum sp.]MBO6684669.1 ATP phosphoribosyltransferase regulatory subunit [Parvibaculum sp.]MBO6904474.1 ATP phosphoribosyltransferase regulatory subunit [Parvibaculum sp.]